MAGEQAPGPSQTNLVGHTLAGRYHLVELLGQGGMGTVYTGKDSQMSDRIVAVKVLAPHLVSDEKQVMRFEQEARAANQLRHPNTISVLDFGRDNAGHIFMVIEFLTGETLSGVLQQGRMDMSRCLYIFRQVCKSLAEAHSKNIVHRDLKPDNIFVCEIYGEADFVKVIDFGIAKFLEDENAQLTQAGKMFGTPRYLSPEQAQGKKLDNRSDLYSLGVIMFECITGRPPFVADEPIAVAIMHVQQAAPHMDEVSTDIAIPEEVDGLVFKLLQKRPEDRYQSAEEVVAAIDSAMAALQRAGAGLPVGHYTPHAALTPARPHTIPPASHDDEATRAMAPIGDAGKAMPPYDPDATRVIEAMSDAPADDPEATRALDTVSAVAAMKPSPGVAAGGDATVALDTVDALKALEKGKQQSAAASKASEGSSGVGRLVLLLIVAVLVVGGGVVVALQSGALGDGEAKAKAKAKQAQLARQKADEERRKRKEAERVAAEKRKEAERKEREKRVLEKKLAAAKAASKVHVVAIESTPPGAKVFLKGMEVGKTPYKLKVTLKDADRTLVLKLDGYEDREVQIKSKAVVEARIERLPSELKKKAPAKPVPVKRAAPKKKKKLDWGM